jgi:hypothetical protein
MLEWLLTGHNLLIATVTSTISIFLVSSVLSTICEGETKTRKRLEQFFMILPMVITLVLISIMIYIKSNTTEEYTHNSDWKVIYTNDIDAKIELHVEVDNLLGLKKRITAGEQLKNTHRILQTTRNGILTATKGDSKENKKIRLDKSNVIVSGSLSSTSKITKIEYRPVTGKRNTAFDKYGDEMTPDIDGEVRVTIESNEDENAKKLKALFGE